MTDMYEQICLADQWLQHGSPAWRTNDDTLVTIVERIDHARLGNLFEGIQAEREAHEARASDYATVKTGYTPNAVELLSDRAVAHDIIMGCEYDRLEAAAKERRIMALAVTIT